MFSFSPLRYPGGKQKIYSFILDLWKTRNLRIQDYYEPFAGGAGLALKLLLTEKVERIHLNDLDPHIHAFWQSLLHESDAFLNKLEQTPVTTDEWQHQKYIYRNSHEFSLLDVGFSTFFLNRCNRSGIISTAGPIGGHTQTGNYKIDARFNKINLQKLILKILSQKNQIFLYNKDCKAFLTECKQTFSETSFVYLDPPYYVAGGKLYLNSFSEEDHRELSEFVAQHLSLNNWMITYDDATFIRELYQQFECKTLDIRYSLQTKRSECEVLILPKVS